MLNQNCRTLSEHVRAPIVTIPVWPKGPGALGSLRYLPASPASSIRLRRLDSGTAWSPRPVWVAVKEFKLSHHNMDI